MPAMSQAVPCPVPAASALGGFLLQADYVDSFAAPATCVHSIVDAYAATLGALPLWFKRLLMVRTAIVRPFGISGPTWEALNEPIDTSRLYAAGDHIGRWKIDSISDREIVAGLNDKHLDFRVSLLKDDASQVFFSTAVKTHNTFGRAYLAIVKPFHQSGVRRLLSNAVRSGKL